MNWAQLISPQRLGLEGWNSSEINEDRTQFQRDYDRIVFSSPFRRMQNKTQVFPLPEHVFVHNRLTHSLEVASVGRSLGNLISEKLLRQHERLFSLSEIGTIVSAACLAHDMGNPPFGHSGESSISNFFLNGYGSQFKNCLTEAQWNDFIYFDGNANAFRILTHQFTGKRPGGFALTYSTLSSIVKYPYESILADKPKFGFFQSEKEVYKKIAESLGIDLISDKYRKFVRHPLVYLVEAADDICYQIMDLEDAYKLGILSFDQVKQLFLSFYNPATDSKRLLSIEKTMQLVTDRHEQVSFLRAGVIGKLIYECAEVFLNNQDDILNGKFDKSLTGSLEISSMAAMKIVKEVSFSEIYNHRSVVEIEIAGYKIIGTLLEEFAGVMLNPKNALSRKMMSLIPEQYKPNDSNIYEQLQSVVDFISGMTDIFALDLYRKIKGINLPQV